MDRLGMEPSRVYITQENPRLNYFSAKEYGDLKVITAHEYSAVSESKVNVIIKEAIEEVIAQFDPITDYVLVSGDPVITALVVHGLLSKHGAITLLKWDNREMKYYCIDIESIE